MTPQGAYNLFFDFNDLGMHPGESGDYK
jgi:hypothetical protein